MPQIEIQARARNSRSGYKVDISRGQRVGRVSSEWFNRPADGLSLRRSRVMGDYRIELDGFTDATAPRLKAFGLMSEIISWKLRLFIPTGEGPAILARILQRHGLVGVTDRASASQEA